MRLQFRVTILASLLLSAAISGVCAMGKGQSTVYQITVDGSAREYILYKPAVSETKGLPLMIVLHGGLGNAKRIEQVTGMNDIADTGTFLVAYPNGTAGRYFFSRDLRTWDAGRCCGQAAERNVNDVLFIEKIIDDVHAKYGIDAARVYVTGLSNGAMMAYRLACEIPHKIAAIIPVAGTLAVDNCDAARVVPVLHIHGDQDEYVPFGGGRGEKSVGKVPHRSVPDTMNLLLRSRRCSAPEQRTLNGAVQVSSYRCSAGAPVELYVIKGGGHGWPGGQGKNSSNAGASSLLASKVAWEFARQFSTTRSYER